MTHKTVTTKKMMMGVIKVKRHRRHGVCVTDPPAEVNSRYQRLFAKATRYLSRLARMTSTYLRVVGKVIRCRKARWSCGLAGSTHLRALLRPALYCARAKMTGSSVWFHCLTA